MQRTYVTETVYPFGERLNYPTIAGWQFAAPFAFILMHSNVARGNVASEFSKCFSAHVTFRGNGRYHRGAPGAWLSDSREIRRVY